MKLLPSPAEVVPAGFLPTGLILSVVLCFCACGKKDLPQPPSVSSPAAVSNLQGRLEKNHILLFWTVPQGETAIKSGLAEFRIFRSRWESSAEYCPDCPRRFHCTGRIPIQKMNRRPDGTLIGRYREAAVPGHTAGYYVVGYSRSGNTGDRSEIVRLTCPPADKKGE